MGTMCSVAVALVMVKTLVGTTLALNDALKYLFYRLWEAVEAYSAEQKYDQKDTFRSTWGGSVDEAADS